MLSEMRPTNIGACRTTQHLLQFFVEAGDVTR